ncbi:DNA-binding response regulator [Sphaerisporangium rufum]|uniref:DNA-binding response regulator n=1 Tax=Sphaerisporangium rufum TaxID=1381558 RepID=A0A919R3Y2_9ACTN|nr:response regulator transcription factor [Sphaerisporangium rufum]GII77905.1 DNA-binding response regulator [Sphaerisporangium rufum]
MIRVLVADDEPLIVEGIRAVLAAAPGIEVVAQAADGRAAVAEAVRHRADVALLDVNMPLLDGLEVLAELGRRAPGVRAVMLTAFGTEPNVRRALRHGAAGFVLKNCAPDELVRAVRAAHQGEAFLSPAVTRLVLGMVPGATGTSGAGTGTAGTTGVVTGTSGAVTGRTGTSGAVTGTSGAATDMTDMTGMTGMAGGAAARRAREAADRLSALTARESQVLALVAEGLSNAEIGRRLRTSETTVKTYVSRVLAKLGCANRVQAALLARDAATRPGAG